MKEKVLEIINNIRAAKDMAPVAELHIEDNLRNDLGLTSFDCLEDSRPFRAVHPHVRDNFYFLYYILYRTSIFDCCFRQKEV